MKHWRSRSDADPPPPPRPILAPGQPFPPGTIAQPSREVAPPAAPSIQPFGLEDMPTLPSAPFAPAVIPAPAPELGPAPSPTAPLLELRGVTVNYGQIAAVRDLSLAVGTGELVALLGANGAGKTTTLRAISGLHHVRSGEILFAGRRITRLGAERIARLGIAHLPEGRGMFPRLSVAENLRMAAYGVGIAGNEYDRRLDAAVRLFPVLRERMGQLAGTLSGGQQQMLAVARALVTRPRLLMIDELSFGLAPVVVKQLFALLPAILADGTSILLVEQFVGQALAVASRAYVLEKGELTFAGPAAALADREGFVESSYLGSGAQRPNYQPVRPKETEMLRVRVEPGLVRRLRAASGGRALPEMANEALKQYLTALEARHVSAGAGFDQVGGGPILFPPRPATSEQRGGAQ